MARPAETTRQEPRLDAPKGLRTSVLSFRNRTSRDRFGRATEFIARAMGTPWFLIGLTLFVLAWMAYNTYAPEQWRFDSAEIGFTALTLILSLQASYAAPLILLAQNRQEARDREEAERDRAQAARALADTEFLARELASIRLALADVATNADLERIVERLEAHRDDGPAANPP